MMITNACMSGYIIKRQRYTNDPFPIITVTGFDEGLMHTMANSQFVTYNGVMDVMLRRIGLDHEMTWVEEAEKVAEFKERVTRYVNGLKKQTFLMALPTENDSWGRTFSWQFNFPGATAGGAGTSFTNWGTTP